MDPITIAIVAALLEARPESAGRTETLQEEMTAVNAEQDDEVLTAAQYVLTLLHAQQAGLGKFTIQNNAPVQGQNIGDHNRLPNISAIHPGNRDKEATPWTRGSIRSRMTGWCKGRLLGIMRKLTSTFMGRTCHSSDIMALFCQ